ncbi:MAG: hypothetical protein NVV73_12365 [Cellvibrionaceae bacterium]|nr:hypothetical protein [Cellvibrionaceae bacterium]
MTAFWITATGPCSWPSSSKDYAHQFAGDPVREPRAAVKPAAAARDFAELCTPMAATYAAAGIAGGLSSRLFAAEQPEAER